MNRDLFQGFIECERERIHDEQLAVLAELKTASCDIHKERLKKRLANLAGQMSMLILCEQIVSNMMADDSPKVKLIRNPVTGKCYEIRQHSSKAGKRGVIKGLWSLK